MSRPVLVVCDTCGATVSPRYAREKVTLYARTTGAGGTLSNVRLVTRENSFRCDSCVHAIEYGTNQQTGLGL